MDDKFIKDFKELQITLSWQDFDSSCLYLFKSITNMLIGVDSVSLLGMARGALPLLTKFSHLTGIRDISIVHSELTLSDVPHDRGNHASITSGFIREDRDNFILLEDIIHTGKSVKTAIDLLKSRGKNIVAIASLVVTDDFIQSDLGSDGVPVIAAYRIPADAWIVFPWER